MYGVRFAAACPVGRITMLARTGTERGFMQDKILLVDDDDLVLACFHRLLGRHFCVETAGPQQALELITSHGPYAVVISDLRMPGLNGVQFLEKAKQLLPLMVGIILTGDMDSDDNDLANNTAVYKVLDKPCPHELLVSVVNEALVHHHKLLEIA